VEGQRRAAVKPTCCRSKLVGRGNDSLPFDVADCACIRLKAPGKHGLPRCGQILMKDVPIAIVVLGWLGSQIPRMSCEIEISKLSASVSMERRHGCFWPLSIRETKSLPEEPSN